MRFITAEMIAKTMGFGDFIDALKTAFIQPPIAPLRQRYEIERPSKASTHMLLMPSWTDYSQVDSANQGYYGLKIVNVHPDNHMLGKAGVQSAYVLFDGQTGEPIAFIDGEALTFWRTSAASALASMYLSRPQSSSLLMVGAGGLAPWLVKAHAFVRPVENVWIWNRTPEKAEQLAANLTEQGITANPVDDLDPWVEQADIISTATLSPEPLVKGEHVRPGTHIDLVGAFTPQLRESDDVLVQKATLFADTKAGALAEAGDFCQPINAGLITQDHIVADLHALTQGRLPGRANSDEITLFKSVGTAIEDLAGAIAIAHRTEKKM